MHGEARCVFLPIEHPVQLLERLEDRLVLSDTPIIAVGLRTWIEGLGTAAQRHPFGAYVMEGTVSDDNVLRYQFQGASPSGFGAPTAWREAGLILNDDGTFRYDSPYWRDVQAGNPDAPWARIIKSNDGAQFLPHDGYDVGWWTGARSLWEPDQKHGDEIVLHREDQYIIPVATGDVERGVLDGLWRYTMLEHWNQQPGDRRELTGELSIDTSINRIRWSRPLTGAEIRLEGIIEYGSGGSFLTGKDHRFHLSEDGETLVFVDGISADGLLHIGIATRVAPAPDEATVAGTYTATHEYAGRTLTFKEDGFAVVNLGQADEEVMGRWLISQDRIWVRVGDSTSGYWHSSVISPDGSTIMGTLEYPYNIITLLRRSVAEPVRSDPVSIHAGYDDAGRAIAHIDRTNAPWIAVDVVQASGGPIPGGTLSAWFDVETGLARVAGVTSDGATIYEERVDGTWTFISLAEVTAVSKRVTRSLTLMDDGKYGIRLFGLADNGDLIAYTPAAPGVIWTGYNISREALRPRGISTPAFAGSLVAYAAPWGAYGVAGVDTAGELHVIWSVLYRVPWRVANLSDISGAPRLSGDLTVSASHRLGIVYVASGADGDQHVISWAPGDAGRWSLTTYQSTSPVQQLGAAVFSRRLGVIFVPVISEDRKTLSMMYVGSPDDAPARIGIRPRIPLDGHHEIHDIESLSVSVGTDGVLSVYVQLADGAMLRLSQEVDVYQADWRLEILPLA